MTYSISAGPNPVSESAGSITLTITRPAGLGAQTLYVSTINGAAHGYATNNNDYVGLTNLGVFFPAGVTTESVSLHINDLGLTSGTLTFGLLVQSVNTPSLTADVLASSTFTIKDNDAPPVLASQTAPQTWQVGQFVDYSLPGNTFTDPQHENLTYTATLASGAALPSWLNFNPSTETFTGAVPSGTGPLSIKVTARDTSGLSTSEIFSVAVPTPAGPKISGTVHGQTDSDESSIHAFSSVVISGSTPTSSESVSITLLDSSGHATDANGTLAGAGLTKTGIGTYSLAAHTPASETSALEALVFTPSAHEVAPGQTVTTTMKLVDTQGSMSVTDSNTSVVATAVNDHPVISGTAPGQTTLDTTAIKPFAHTTISSIDIGVQEAVTITLLNSTGHATDANGMLSGTGLSHTGTGTYQIGAGTPSIVTSELDTLLFAPTPHESPAGQTVATTFELSVAQGGAITTNAGTTVVATETAPALANDIARAETEIGEQVAGTLPLTSPLQGALYLNDPQLVKFLASDIAALYHGGDYTIGAPDTANAGFINNPGSLTNASLIDQCVALVQGLDPATMAPTAPQGTKSWTDGLQVDLGGSTGLAGEDLKISAGTPIATFVNNAGNQVTSLPAGTGNYPESALHAGIFLGYGVEQGQYGFFMLDQYVNQPTLNPHSQPAEVRFYPFASSTGHAVEYYTIVPH